MVDRLSNTGIAIAGGRRRRHVRRKGWIWQARGRLPRALGQESVEDKPAPRCPTEQDGDLKRAVGENQLLGRSAGMLDADQPQVAEDAVENEGDGEHHGMIGGDVGGGEGIETVGHNSGAGDDGDQLVEQGDVIAIQYPAVGFRFSFQKRKLRAAFAEPNEEREKGCNNIQPGGEALHGDEHHASGNPQDVAGGDDQHIDQGNVFEPDGVSQVDQEIDQGNDPDKPGKARRISGMVIRSRTATRI